MDREISEKQIMKRRLKTGLKAALIILPILALLFALGMALKTSIRRDMIRTAVAEIGPIEATITASGIVVPEYEQVITSPIQSKIEQVLKAAGEHVQEGEPIILLNTGA